MIISKENTRTYRLCPVKNFFHTVYLLLFRRELCFCAMLHSKYVVFEEMIGMAVHHLFIYCHSLDPYRITESTYGISQHCTYK